ncbi:MAG: hypothetical protein ACP5SH_25140 [Syntrophobacteraceae bacterium]
MNTDKDTSDEMIKRLELSLDSIFQRAGELNASFENSPKPRQKRIVEILHKHGLPACVGPFFDTYSRISASGGDIEQFNRIMVTKISSYLQEVPSVVEVRFKQAIDDYIESKSRDSEAA